RLARLSLSIGRSGFPIRVLSPRRSTIAEHCRPALPSPALPSSSRWMRQPSYRRMAKSRSTTSATLLSTCRRPSLKLGEDNDASRRPHHRGGCFAPPPGGGRRDGGDADSDRVLPEHQGTCRLLGGGIRS